MLVMRIFLNDIVIESKMRMRAVFCFSRKNNFIFLFIGIRIKLYFSLKSKFTILLILQIYLYPKLLRKGKYHQQKFYILMFFHQQDHL